MAMLTVPNFGLSSCVARQETPMAELLSHARDAGIRAVEIGYERSGPALADEGLRHKLIEETSGHDGLVRSLHAPYTPERDLSNLDDKRRQLAIGNNCAALQLTKELGVGIMVLHASEDPILEGDRSRRLTCALDSLLQVQEEARRLSIRLAVETMPPEWIPAGLDEVARLSEALDPDVVGFCFDVNHSNLNVDPVEYINLLGPRIIAIHISDNDGLRQRHWIPGEGVVDWAAFGRALLNNKVDAPPMYEVEPDMRLEDSIPKLQSNFERLFG
jgi:sugar phosphate isomerase/epimerase